MSNSVKVILLSQLPLPYSKIGSWTTMYNYLITQTTHKIDYIICPKPENEISSLQYQIVRKLNFIDKLKSKYLNKSNRFNNYFEALSKLIKQDQKYIIHIIDNSGIVSPLNDFINKKYNRINFYIQYYYQGFAPIFPKEKSKNFIYGVDEILFLSNLSYKSFISFYNDNPYKASILYNATNSKQFKKINPEQKAELRSCLKIDNKSFIFLWCSQDRPKKGLHIILEAFKKIYEKNKFAKLLVIGIDREIVQKGVQVVGKIPNNELAKYYQIADVYLFPSLWKEGFGIVLAESLKCGNYVIASALGAIPEVLAFGNYGKLIDSPNFVDDWVDAMMESIEVIDKNNGNPYLENIPEQLYDLSDWISQLNQIIEKAKESIYE